MILFVVVAVLADGTREACRRPNAGGIMAYAKFAVASWVAARYAKQLVGGFLPDGRRVRGFDVVAFGERAGSPAGRLPRASRLPDPSGPT